MFESAIAGLVDHQLAGPGLQLVDEVVAVLAAQQQASKRALRADWRARGAAALELGRRAIGEVGQMSFARVRHIHSLMPGGRQQRTDRT